MEPNYETLRFWTTAAAMVGVGMKALHWVWVRIKAFFIRVNVEIPEGIKDCKENISTVEEVLKEHIRADREYQEKVDGHLADTNQRLSGIEGEQRITNSLLVVMCRNGSKPVDISSLKIKDMKDEKEK